MNYDITLPNGAARTRKAKPKKENKLIAVVAKNGVFLRERNDGDGQQRLLVFFIKY
jgi:hypothetical protein